MIGIDTNVLVRYLVRDDEHQHKQADALITHYITNSRKIFINNIVICELIWVLGSKGYKYSRLQISDLLKELLSTVEFEFEEHHLLWLSFLEYKNSTADFSDILISKINTQHNCRTTYSFDKGTKLINGITLLS